MSNVLVLFVEGDTELEFYIEVLSFLRSRCRSGMLPCKIIKKNLKGIGNFKNKALRIFTKNILPKYHGRLVDVFCVMTQMCLNIVTHLK